MCATRHKWLHGYIETGFQKEFKVSIHLPLFLDLILDGLTRSFEENFLSVSFKMSQKQQPLRTFIHTEKRGDHY